MIWRWDRGKRVVQKDWNFCRAESENAARKNGSGDGGGGGSGVASQSEAACCIRASVQVCRGVLQQQVFQIFVDHTVSGLFKLKVIYARCDEVMRLLAEELHLELKPSLSEGKNHSPLEGSASQT